MFYCCFQTCNFFYSLSANICSFLSVSQQLNTSVVHFSPKHITIKH